MVFINPNWNFSSRDLLEKAKAASNTRSYERLLALALILEGDSPKRVAQIIHRHYNTVLDWVDRYNEGSVDALYYFPPNGQQSWLSSVQMEQLKAAVQKSPKKSGLEGVQWIYKQVKEFCKLNFQISIKERTAQKYLKKLGFVRKRPRQQYKRASEEKKENLLNI